MTTSSTSTAPARAGTPRAERVRLAGFRPLLKVSLRQDIRNIAPWVVIITALSASSILAYAWIFPDQADRAALSASLGANPALSLIFGPANDLMTSDGFNAWRAGQLGAFFAGLMAVLTVVRNSRANEDSGQAELIASAVIARETRLAVAVAMASIGSILIGIVCFIVTMLCGGGLTATAILSATFTASGLMFTGIAAIAVQLGSDARTASSIGVGTLGVLYVLRGYIDTAGLADWVTWLTPFGWLEETAPATDDNPWPLLLSLAFAVVTIAAGFVLQGHRDFGQGMVAQRPGPREAGLAGNVWGLALKLNLGSTIAWLIAFAGLGLLFGTLATSIGDIITENPAMAQILASGAADASDLTFAFLATILQIIAIIASVMGVQVALSIYTEEINYRVEPLLAASLRRSTYFASNALIALTGPALAMLVAGTGLGLVAHGRDDTIAVSDVLQQAIVTIPAVWVLVGLALAAVGARPVARLIGWAGVVATFALTLLGPTFNLPDWALDISPLRHVPNVTAPDADWTGLAWLCGIAVAFLAVAFAGFRRRDVI